MTLRELADAIATLTETARAGKTTPADMAGGTITITNVGVFGVDTGTPILNPGESGIVAFGAVRRMPWVVDEQIVPRWVTQLAVSFDHRIVDGQQGSQFPANLAAILHDPGLAILQIDHLSIVTLDLWSPSALRACSKSKIVGDAADWRRGSDCVRPDDEQVGTEPRRRHRASRQQDHGGSVA